MWRPGEIRGSVVIEGQTGTYGYHAGATGTVTLPVGSHTLSMAAFASGSSGSVTINGGDTIIVPPDGVVQSQPNGNLVSAVFVFTNTTAYFVEYIV